MWFRWLMIALGVLMLATFVFERLFWWFMIAAGVVMFAGVVIEVFWYWREERAERRACEEHPPKRALAATASSNATQDKE